MLPLLKDQGFELHRFSNTNNYPLLKSIINTLLSSDLLEKRNNLYFFTTLGNDLFTHFSLIQMFFEGYGNMIAHQVEICKNKIEDPYSLANPHAIADASVLFSKDDVSLISKEFFEKYKPIGTICDLGCGNGQKLLDFQRHFGNPALGIEYSQKVVDESQKKLKNHPHYNIQIEQGDITDIKGVWEDVTVIMQHYVFHDFVPSDVWSALLSRLKYNFPNLKYFVYLDIVAPCDDNPINMPGFDYVHGLLGKEMRNYRETLQMFENSGFKVLDEHPIESLPCTYLWILAPKTIS